MSRKTLIVLTVLAGLIVFSVAAAVASRQPVQPGRQHAPTSTVSQRVPTS